MLSENKDHQVIEIQVRRQQTQQQHYINWKKCVKQIPSLGKENCMNEMSGRNYFDSIENGSPAILYVILMVFIFYLNSIGHLWCDVVLLWPTTSFPPSVRPFRWEMTNVHVKLWKNFFLSFFFCVLLNWKMWQRLTKQNRNINRLILLNTDHSHSDWLIEWSNGIHVQKKKRK